MSRHVISIAEGDLSLITARCGNGDHRNFKDLNNDGQLHSAELLYQSRTP